MYLWLLSRCKDELKTRRSNDNDDDAIKTVNETNETSNATTQYNRERNESINLTAEMNTYLQNTSENDYDKTNPKQPLATKQRFPNSSKPVDWFNKTYNSNLGMPENITELMQVLLRKHRGLVNEFIDQWKSDDMTVSKYIQAFEEDAGGLQYGRSAGNIVVPSSGTTPYGAHRQRLKDEFIQNEIDSSKGRWTPPAISVNNDNLNIALLYPGVASYLKKVRSRLLNNSYAVRSAIAPGFFPGAYPFRTNTGITLQIGGGELNTQFPIEMKGLGPLIASSMRGGGFPSLAIGTVNSPTIWRPLTDDSYIGDSLMEAIQKLKGKLRNLNMNLDAGVDAKIAQRLGDLKTAETRAKNLRDKLTKAAAQVTSGNNAGASNFKTGALAGNTVSDNDVDNAY
jgi:hypothetical protein